MIKYSLLVIALIFLNLSGKAQNFKHAMQADAGVMIGEQSLIGLSAQIFNGFKIMDLNTEAGLAVGFDYYQQMNFIPISAGVKWFILETKVFSPFIGVKGGYAFALKENLGEFETVKGGIMFNAVAGVRFIGKSKSGISLTAGFRLQEGTLTYDDSNVNDYPILRTQEYIFKRLYLGIGAGF